MWLTKLFLYQNKKYFEKNISDFIYINDHHFITIINCLKWTEIYDLQPETNTFKSTESLYKVKLFAS